MASDLECEIEAFKEYVIIVEGKKDVAALNSLGFERVFAIHSIGKSVRERIEQIVSKTGTGRIFCILTDLDKQGKKFYSEVRLILQELGAKVDTGFRGILIRENVSHLEGFDRYLSRDC